MPDMTGYDVIRRLRGNPTTAHIRTIVLTARGQPIDRRVAAEAGADTFLIKPVETNVLLEKINELLGKTPSKGGALIVGVMGLAGGVGKTTVAVNLALLLQQVGQTLLVDLSQFRACALFLGLKPVRQGFLLENPGLTTEGLMQRHDSGLNCWPRHHCRCDEKDWTPYRSTPCSNCWGVTLASSSWTCRRRWTRPRSSPSSAPIAWSWSAATNRPASRPLSARCNCWKMSTNAC